jgi:hypothetical protein
MGITSDLLHSIFRTYWSVIPYYQLSPSPFLDLRRLPT